MDPIGSRLREERARLGLSQTEFGKRAGVVKRSQLNYEKGTRRPDAAYFKALADMGVDVTYIVTGNRSGTSQALADVKAAVTAAALTAEPYDRVAESQGQIYNALRDAHARDPEERQLLDDYRRCALDDQAVIRQLALRLAKPTRKRKFRKA